MNTNFYYNKYLKYKNKYLKFKEQNGGMGKTKCPQLYEGQSVAALLREYDCTYRQIPKTNLLDKFDYCALQEANLDETKHKITIADLKSRGFPPKFFKDKGFPINELIEAGYLVFKLIEAGFTYKDMKDAGISLKTLNKSGLDITAEDTFKKLKDAGYTIKDFFDVYAKPSKDVFNCEKKIGNPKIRAYEVKASSKALQTLYYIVIAGFTLEEIIGLKEFTREQLLEIFKEEDVKEKLIDKEYTLEEILAEIRDESGNFDYTKLKRINDYRENKINLNLIKSHIPFSILFDSSYSPKDLLNSGFSPNEIICLYKERNKLNSYLYNLNSLKKLFTLENLLINKISLEDILQIGYEPCELKNVGISAESFKEIIQKDKSLLKKLKCYALKELKDAGYDEKEILKLDYSFEELKCNGYTLKLLLEIFTKKNIDENILRKFPLDELIENYEFKELKVFWWFYSTLIKSTACKLKEKGFTPEILHNHFGLKINELLKLGFDINELKDLPDIVIFLRRQGYNLEFFKSNNFNVQKLIVEGKYTVNELKCAGYSADVLKDYFHIIELKDAGYNILEMITAGFSPLQLYLIGYDKEDIIKENGANDDLSLLSNFVNIAKNSDITDDERKTVIKQFLDYNNEIFLKLYFLRNHEIPLHLIIAALDNLENKFNCLKYVFIPDDFYKDQIIELAYYADKFPVNDLLNCGITPVELVKTLSKDKNKVMTPEEKREADNIHQSYVLDNKKDILGSIIRDNNLDQLLRYHPQDGNIKETLTYYLRDPPYMTPLHPWYKNLKKIDDEISKRYVGL